MRRVVVLFAVLWGVLLLAYGQNDFKDACWVGAITRKDARLPEGRNFTGAKLKEPLVRAAWMAADKLSDKSIYLRRSIKLQGVVRQATVYIVGLGFYELTIDGSKVGDAEFAPLWSDYDKSIFYNEYDVTDYFLSKTSKHLLQVLLGNGFYNEQGKRYAKMNISFGPPTLLFHLHIVYLDGRTQDVVSDASWQWAQSPITFNSIYGGEDYDARMVPSTWQPVVIQEAPKGILRKQMAEPVKIMERYGVKDTVRCDSVLVLDMGQNLAGFPAITVCGKVGQRLKLIPGETLNVEDMVTSSLTGYSAYDADETIYYSIEEETGHIYCKKLIEDSLFTVSSEGDYSLDYLLKLLKG